MSNFDLFADYTRQLMGDDRYTTFRNALDAEPPVSIRFNPFKMTEAEAQAFAPADDNGQPVAVAAEVPWCAQGRYLTRRPAFTLDPMLHAGVYYVQEASSMFVWHALRQFVDRPVTMLDLCAAPGGKTTAVRSALPEGSLLFSNEPMKLRASILTENLEKFGHPDLIVTNNYPKDYRRAGLLFDVVLADVPCSGEGMFRKDKGAIDEWSPQNVEKCWRLQRSIIEDIWPCLRPGGLLLYSTCTFNAHEDEDNVAWIAETLGAEVVAIDHKPGWNIQGALTGDLPVCRFIPGFTRGEGLFMAALRKTGGETLTEGGKSGGKQKKHDKQKKDKGGSHFDRLADWLEGDLAVVAEGDTLRAIPHPWLPVYEKARQALHVLHAGVTLGEMKGKDLVPDESLALSTRLRPDAFPRVEVDYSQAIAYLRREAVTLPEDTPRGYVLVCFHGHALGFAKNIGNRANNLYPKEWKIKKSL